MLWAVTVGVGMALRALAGQGTEPAFVVVAAVVLGALLLGWRAATAAAVRARTGTDRRRPGRTGRAGIPPEALPWLRGQAAVATHIGPALVWTTWRITR